MNKIFLSLTANGRTKQYPSAGLFANHIPHTAGPRVLHLDISGTTNTTPPCVELSVVVSCALAGPSVGRE